MTEVQRDQELEGKVTEPLLLAYLIFKILDGWIKFAWMQLLGINEYNPNSHDPAIHQKTIIEASDFTGHRKEVKNRVRLNSWRCSALKH